MYKYTKIPTDTFKKLVQNAGFMCRSFDPATGEASGLIGATTGGLTAVCTPTYADFGDDIDNCPKNMMELKQITEYDCNISGTLITTDKSGVKMLLGAADETNGVIKPRFELTTEDFNDVWMIADYGDKHSGAEAGYVAIHIKNALNTSGFSLKTTDKGKGQFAFTLTGHVSMDNQDDVPFEVIIGNASGDTPYVAFDVHSMTITVGDEVALGYEVNPAGTSVTFSSSASGKASVTSAGVVEGLEAGSTVITATITSGGVTYTDSCTVIVEAAQG